MRLLYVTAAVVGRCSAVLTFPCTEWAMYYRHDAPDRYQDARLYEATQNESMLVQAVDPTMYPIDSRCSDACGACSGQRMAHRANIGSGPLVPCLSHWSGLGPSQVRKHKTNPTIHPKPQWKTTRRQVTINVAGVLRPAWRDKKNPNEQLYIKMLPFLRDVSNWIRSSLWYLAECFGTAAFRVQNYDFF